LSLAKTLKGTSAMSAPDTSGRFAQPVRDRLPRVVGMALVAALGTSPGAHAYYDDRRADGHNQYQALRAVSNLLVGILHGCLRQGTFYDEATAWPRYQKTQDQAAA
jgi:hypothetical protein